MEKCQQTAEIEIVSEQYALFGFGFLKNLAIRKSVKAVLEEMNGIVPFSAKRGHHVDGDPHVSQKPHEPTRQMA